MTRHDERRETSVVPRPFPGGQEKNLAYANYINTTCPVLQTYVLRVQCDAIRGLRTSMHHAQNIRKSELPGKTPVHSLRPEELHPAIVTEFCRLESDAIDKMGMTE
jgi:hypothetical protein